MDDKTYYTIIDLALEHRDRGEGETVQELLTTCTRARPDKVEAFHHMGVTALKRGDAHKALEHFFEALEVRPNFHYTEYEVGCAYETLGELGEARRWFELVLESHPDYGAAWKRWALLERRVGRSGPALDRLRRGLDRNPNDPNLLLEIGRTLTYQGRMSEAVPFYEQMIALVRSNEAIEEYMSILASLGDYNRVIEFCSKSEFSQEASSIEALRIASHAKMAISYISKKEDSRDNHLSLSNHWRQPEDIIRVIKDSLERKIPFSLVRIGDGEGRFFSYFSEEVRGLLTQGELYAMVNSIWQHWFGSEIQRHDSEAVSQLHSVVLQSLSSADVLGVPNTIRLSTDYQHVAYLRKSLDVVTDVFLSQKSTVNHITDAFINIEIHRLMPFYGKILADLEFLGIVTCHIELGAILQRAHRIKTVRVYQVPGEFGQPQLSDRARAGRHFPDRYEALCESLAVPFEGALFLVGAGLLGKVYCKIIKERGGIAIDVGSVMDAWMGLNTRSGSYDRIEDWVMPRGSLH
jgi:tetratricopeptide (TPR) repeat protein